MRRVIVLLLVFGSVPAAAQTNTGISRAPVDPAVGAVVGKVARSAVGQVGQRQDAAVLQDAAGIMPMQRIDTRINSRLRGRVRNRIGRD